MCPLPPPSTTATTTSSSFKIYNSALERKRTITSISLSEEKQILKQIAGIKKTKTQVEEYNVHNKSIQDLKVCVANVEWCNLKKKVVQCCCGYLVS